MRRKILSLFLAGINSIQFSPASLSSSAIDMSYTDCKVHADLLVGAVLHLFDSKIVNTRTQLILMRDPILVDCNSSISASGKPTTTHCT